MEFRVNFNLDRLATDAQEPDAFLAQRKPKLSFLTFFAKKERLKTGAEIPQR